MAWDTQLGVRVLEGVEAKFYLNAMRFAVEYLEEAEELGDESDVETGDRIFDSASFDQKIVLLHYCLSALLQPEVFPPKLTNVMEAATFLPFAFLKMKVDEEIEDEMVWGEDEATKNTDHDLIYFYRRFVWDAYKALILEERQSRKAELDDEDGEPLLDYHSRDRGDWVNRLDELASRIFYDRDWQITSFHPQLLDGLSESFSEQTGIDEEYVTNRLPKVTTEQTVMALSALDSWKLYG
jgi:hypothetical protein